MFSYLKFERESQIEKDFLVLFIVQKIRDKGISLEIVNKKVQI